MLIFKFLIKSLFLTLFCLDLEPLFQILDQLFSIDVLQAADPMTRDNQGGRGLDDDDPDEEKIGGPGNPPPKPWYQKLDPGLLAGAILFGTIGLGLLIASFIVGGGQGNAPQPGPVNQPPMPGAPDAQVRLAGGSADAINDPNSGQGPVDGDSGGD